MLNIYSILDAFTELVYVADTETHEILYLNKAGKEIFGDCEGKLCYEVFQGKNERCSYCPTEKLCEKEFYEWIHTNEITGKTFMLRDKIVNWNGRKAQMEIAFDITESELHKQDLEMRLDMEHFLVTCIVEMHNNKPFDEAMNNLLAMIGKFLEAERVYVFDYDGKKTNNTHEWCADGVEPQIDTLQNLDASIIDRWLPDFRRGDCVITADVEEIKDIAPDEYETLVRQGIHSLVTAPLDDNGQLIGYIGVDNPPKEKISKSEKFFMALCYFVSSMVIKNNNEEIFRKMSYTDALTGLYNRNKFIDDCETMPEENKKNLGVLYMDLNGLKQINDVDGHDEGDKALKVMAEALIKAFGMERSYRVGGDEFVAICQKMSEENFLTRVNDLKRILSEMEYSSAIGYHYSKGECDIDELVRTADEKMYLDKKYFYRRQKSGRYRFNNDIFMALSTPDAIKKLIDEERFVIWFQPRFDANTGAFCGSEALIRFFDEDDVIVSPMDFIPDLEDNSTIHLIDLYVFRHVCEYISGWIEQGKDVKPVSVNMSHRTLMKSNFVENIMNIWYDYNIPKELIIIEVSEDKDKGGVAGVVDILSDLKKRGFKIAIDNFGAKYADLYLFADLKFDILKLDGDMVYKIENDEKTRLLSRSIAQICHNENINIVAEGVENEVEFQFLKEIGCDEVQGYLFDKPMSWNRFQEKYL